ncbi:DUF4157 domain-containing protein, partial [Streptomyces sp. WAC06614]|uniref:eCIS core domain-containing protein n=1 Tax=Streptomyces sp. WAC06614 TaxID=2487416 RepID=UPI000FBC1D53
WRGGTAPPGPSRPATEPEATAVVPRDMAAAFARLYGVDVSAVPVHRGRAASERAAKMSARAFTEGGAVFLPKEAGDLESTRGRGLLAHELTHAVQQNQHGGALPAEDTAAGLALEIEALRAELYFRGEPGAPEPTRPAPEPEPAPAPAAPEPAPADCDHTGSAGVYVPPISWTPETGMVTGGVQRASADEITQEYLDNLNELRKELGQGGRVSAVSELTHEQRIDLELRLRKAGVATNVDEEDDEVRPMDWAELFAQSVSSVTSGLMRPFYSRSAEEQRESRDEWRQWAVDRGWGSPTADRSFLDDEDENEDEASDERWSDDDPDVDPVPPGAGKAHAATGAATDAAAPAPELELDDADLVRPLYRHLVMLLEQDGLLPTGSATKATGPAGGVAPGDATAPDEGPMSPPAADGGRAAATAPPTEVALAQAGPAPFVQDGAAATTAASTATGPATTAPAGAPVDPPAPFP